SQGGGIANSDGDADLLNSTVSGNHSNLGGGMFNDFGTLILNNSTIAANVVPGGLLEDGGGIYNAGWVEIRNTIVAANTATVEFFSEGNGFSSSGDFNMIGTNSGITAGVNDHLGVTAAQLKLGALQDNGGPT